MKLQNHRKFSHTTTFHCSFLPAQCWDVIPPPPPPPLQPNPPPQLVTWCNCWTWRQKSKSTCARALAAELAPSTFILLESSSPSEKKETIPTSSSTNIPASNSTGYWGEVNCEGHSENVQFGLSLSDNIQAIFLMRLRSVCCANWVFSKMNRIFWQNFNQREPLKFT